MAKKRIETTLKTTDSEVKKNTLAIVNNKTIKYRDDDVLVTIEYNEEMLTLKRENNEYEIILPFKGHTKLMGTYRLKEENLIMDLEVETKTLLISTNQIEIIYHLNDEKREYRLKIEE